VDTNYGQVPLTVNFSNQSSGAIDSYSWDFGDGNKSSEANPSHTYAYPGDYTITLTVYGPGGSSSASATISAYPAFAHPVALFDIKYVDDFTIQFVNESSGDIKEYDWDFGDGTTSQDENPVHSYAKQGFYNVTLTVYSSINTSATYTYQVKI